MRKSTLSTLLFLLLLGACKPAGEEPAQPGADAPSSDASPTEAPVEAVSILRPDVEAEADVVTPAQSYEATIGFPDGGSEIDADALDVLQEVVASQQFALATPIILRTHSDSAGSDEANARASEARGLAVAEWLIQAGADPERIDVVVFGEQNPIAPNALANGAPNEAGRAANRRVEIEILPLVADAAKETSSGASPSKTSPSEASDKP